MFLTKKFLITIGVGLGVVGIGAAGIAGVVKMTHKDSKADENAGVSTIDNNYEQAKTIMSELGSIDEYIDRTTNSFEEAGKIIESLLNGEELAADAINDIYSFDSTLEANGIDSLNQLKNFWTNKKNVFFVNAFGKNELIFNNFSSVANLEELEKKIVASGDEIYFVYEDSKILLDQSEWGTYENYLNLKETIKSASKDSTSDDEEMEKANQMAMNLAAANYVSDSYYVKYSSMKFNFYDIMNDLTSKDSNISIKEKITKANSLFDSIKSFQQSMNKDINLMLKSSQDFYNDENSELEEFAKRYVFYYESKTTVGRFVEKASNEISNIIKEMMEEDSKGDE